MGAILAAVSFLLGLLVAAVPLKLRELEFGSAVLCWLIELSNAVTTLMGGPVAGTFDGHKHPTKLARLRKVRA